MSAHLCRTRRSCHPRHPQSRSFRWASRWPSAPHLDRDRGGGMRVEVQVQTECFQYTNGSISTQLNLGERWHCVALCQQLSLTLTHAVFQVCFFLTGQQAVSKLQLTSVYIMCLLCLKPPRQAQYETGCLLPRGGWSLQQSHDGRADFFCIYFPKVQSPGMPSAPPRWRKLNTWHPKHVTSAHFIYIYIRENVNRGSEARKTSGNCSVWREGHRMEKKNNGRL